MPTYIFKSPVKIRVFNTFFQDSQIEWLSNKAALEQTLDEASVEGEPTDLADYIVTSDYDIERGYGPIDKAVTSIPVADIEVEKIDYGPSHAVALTKVHTSRKLTDEEVEKLKDYLRGQFADGWGEGFEQFPFYQFTTREKVEKTGYKEKMTYKYFAKFWYSDHSEMVYHEEDEWFITLEKVKF